MVTGTDCIGSGKSNYHTITTCTVPSLIVCTYTVYLTHVFLAEESEPIEDLTSEDTGIKLDIKNYRHKTISSGISSMFTSILNGRLNACLEEFSILNENQAGFRQGYSITDPMFSLYALFEVLCIKK